MKQISVERKTYENLEAIAKKRGMKVEEYVAQIVIEQMRDAEDVEEINVKVPANLMRLLEAEHFFGCTRDQFLTKSIKRSIDVELNSLPIEHMRRLERKYNLEVGGFISLS